LIIVISLSDTMDQLKPPENDVGSLLVHRGEEMRISVLRSLDGNPRWVSSSPVLDQDWYRPLREIISKSPCRGSQSHLLKCSIFTFMQAYKRFP
jgi:hypothetical protein